MNTKQTEALKPALDNTTRNCDNSEEQRVLDALLREALAEQPAKCKHNVFAPYRCTQCEAEQQEPSPTAGMNIAQRILHVGGRNNAAGYVEFGSIQSVEALVRQVLRDLPAQAPAWPKHKPETSLHEIVLDGVYRGFLNDQIIEETCGLATHKMLNFYRYAIDLEMGLQEPVAILNHAHGVHAIRSVKLNGLPDGEYRLYTSPRLACWPWVGLTDVERAEVQYEAHKKKLTPLEFMELHEAKLREKNNG